MRGNAPELKRVLLVESGPHDMGARAVGRLYELGAEQVDVLTCYPDPPAGFDAGRGTVLSIHSPEARQSRSEFLNALCRRPYTTIATVHVQSTVMENWKFLLFAKAKSRVWLLGEDLQMSRLTWRAASNTLARRINPLRRVNLNLPTAIVASLGAALLAPFKIAFLVGFTFKVHARRAMRSAR